MNIFLCLTYFFDPIFMSGVSSELSSSTQLLAVTLYIKFLPFWLKMRQINQITWRFLTKKLALIRKRTRQIQTNQAERTTQRKTSSKWAWTPRTSCRWRHRTSWRCFLSKQIFWAIIWNVRPKKLVKSSVSNLTKNKSWWTSFPYLCWRKKKKSDSDL